MVGACLLAVLQVFMQYSIHINQTVKRQKKKFKLTTLDFDLNRSIFDLISKNIFIQLFIPRKIRLIVLKLIDLIPVNIFLMDL